MTEFRTPGETSGLIESACNIIDMSNGTRSVEFTNACSQLATAYAMIAIAEELANVRTALEAFCEAYGGDAK